VKSGDAAVYMQANCDFHFTLYRAQPQKTLTQLIETLWLQFGPYMRVLYGRVPNNAELNDRHQAAIAAIEANDAECASRRHRARYLGRHGLAGPQRPRA
jgi:DNA-binding GntR family transcriptional regulator